MSLSISGALTFAEGLGLDSIDSQVLLAYVLKKPRTHLIAWPEKPLSAAECDDFRAVVERRKLGEPVAYITGVREFWSLPIQTSPSTLIPRPDTEVLIETVLERHDKRPLRCVDLGTGTGAIALAIKSERPGWQVLGLDRVDCAVELARHNADQLSLDVTFNAGNWCEGIEASSIDLIVSNPPYIDSEDPHLSEGDVRFEPKSALVAEGNGYSDIKTIAAQAKNCLRPGGALYFEHGWQQGAGVRQILIENDFSKVETAKDYGGNERVTFGFLIAD